MQDGKLVRFREFSSNPTDLAALIKLYAGIYIPEFPDPNERESLENMQRYLTLKAEGWYGKNNYHIVAAMDGERALGLAVFDYLADSNCGVIEFLMTTSDARQTGLGARLRAYAEEILSADAQRNGKALACVLAEMNDPFAVNSLDDNLDPFVRARIWGKWGYKRLDFSYLQPALSEEQEPVRNLLLLAKPVDPAYASKIPTEMLLSAIRGYMTWAMRINTPDENPEYEDMARCLKGVTHVAILSLDAYVGYDESRPLYIHEITEIGDRKLKSALSVYQAAFPGAVTDIPPESIESLLSRKEGALQGWTYHLWAIGASDEQQTEGIASFFALQHGGFGGYVALSGALRGSGRFALLLARMEEAVRRDRPYVNGFFIECDPAKEQFFSQFGFRAVAITYLQPPLPHSEPYQVSEAPPLKLMYKTLGAARSAPQLSREEFFAALSDIFEAVYGITNPENSAFFAAMKRESKHWSKSAIPFAN